MPKRTMVIFWAAVAAAVLLLGGGFATLRRVLAGGDALDWLVLSLSAIGLAGALFVAGRIVLVAAVLSAGPASSDHFGNPSPKDPEAGPASPRGGSLTIPP